MLGKGFSHHVSRSQMEGFTFTSCSKCGHTVIRALVKATQRDQIFEPQPTGGNEINPAYLIHTCPRVPSADA